MRATIVSLAGATALAFSAPLAAQGEGGFVYDIPMDCGIANAYLSGIVEEDDPEFSADLFHDSTVWLIMAHNRFGGEDANFEARVNSRTEELTKQLSSMSDEEEMIDFFDTMLSSCETIRAANSAEYDQAEAAMK